MSLVPLSPVITIRAQLRVDSPDRLALFLRRVSITWDVSYFGVGGQAAVDRSQQRRTFSFREVGGPGAGVINPVGLRIQRLSLNSPLELLVAPETTAVAPLALAWFAWLVPRAGQVGSVLQRMRRANIEERSRADLSDHERKMRLAWLDRREAIFRRMLADGEFDETIAYGVTVEGLEGWPLTSDTPPGASRQSQIPDEPPPGLEPDAPLRMQTEVDAEDTQQHRRDREGDG